MNKRSHFQPRKSSIASRLKATTPKARAAHEAAMTFEEWRKEAEQMLMAWHHDDPASVDKDHWQQCFDRNYRPWEAARYAAELLRQRATATGEESRSRAQDGTASPRHALGGERGCPRVPTSMSRGRALTGGLNI